MPEFITSDGCRIPYELAGSGPSMVLTPGGREGKAALAPLVRALEPHFRILTWDRRNCGKADLWFDAERSEQAVWAKDLADLMEATNFGPAWIAGGSAGCRVSINAVLRESKIANGLILWSASGGAYGSQFLGFSYHVPYIMAAQRGGMAAVAETTFFADRIAANPAARDHLMAFDPEEFIAIMRRWNESFYPREGEPLAGIEGDLASISMPTLIFEGNDDIHPSTASLALADAIAGAHLAPSPWTTSDFLDVFTGRTPGSIFDLYPRLVPQIVEFVRQAPVP